MSRVAMGLILSFLLATCAGAEERNDYWPQWRGPLATGEGPRAEPPLKWSEQENVRWKLALPGKGHSTPILWKQHIFLTATIPVGPAMEPKYSGAPGAHDNLPVTHRQQFVVLAVDRQTGKLRWRKVVHTAVPHEGAHETASLASHSPVTDGQRVIASFGSQGIYCLDFDGELLWKRQLGTMNTKHGHGEGSSPALHKGTLLINWDHEGDSFLFALDATTGKDKWKAARREVTSWSTPIVVEHEGRSQAIVPGTSRVRAYDLESGNVIWECGGLSANIVASPVAGQGLVFIGSSYEIRSLLAIRLAGSEGDITGSKQVVWSRQRGTPYVPSPLLYRGSLYFLRHYQGILTRVEARSGAEKTGPLRLDGLRNIYASPVAAAGRIYVTDRDGGTLVISHDDPPRALAFNRLNDRFSASVALAGRELYLRGERYLYCLADDSE